LHVSPHRSARGAQALLHHPAPLEHIMSLRPPRNTPLPSDRPPVDEWGIYDPEQAGLAALYQLLDTRRMKEPENKSLAASMEEARRRFEEALERDRQRLKNKK
jgi:hypothetical protein